MAFDLHIEDSPLGSLSEADYSYELNYLNVDNVEYRFTYHRNRVLVTNEDFYILLSAHFTGDTWHATYLVWEDEISENDVYIEETTNVREIATTLIAECL